MYTRESILSMIDSSNRAVERAILAINARQTEDERVSGETRHRNGRGWNGRDAGYGGYLAGYIGNGNHLTGRYLESGRKMVRKYVGQLVEVANGSNSEHGSVGVNQ